MLRLTQLGLLLIKVNGIKTVSAFLLLLCIDE